MPWLFGEATQPIPDAVAIQRGEASGSEPGARRRLHMTPGNDAARRWLTHSPGLPPSACGNGLRKGTTFFPAVPYGFCRKYGRHPRIAENFVKYPAAEQLDLSFLAASPGHRETRYSNRVGEDGSESIPPEQWAGGFFTAVGESGSKRCYQGTVPVLSLHLIGTTPEPAPLLQVSGSPSEWH